MNRIYFIPKDKKRISFLHDLMAVNQIQLIVLDSLSEIADELHQYLILTEETIEAGIHYFLDISTSDESLLSQIQLVLTIKEKLLPEIKREFPSREKLEKEYVSYCLKNLVHSASQGNGLGSFVTYVDLMQMLGKKENGKYIIEEDIVAGLISSANSARERLEKWGECINILGNVYIQENVSIQKIRGSVSNLIETLKNFQEIKKHKLEFNLASVDKEISLNLTAFHILIREGILNAFKFSNPNSRIDLYGKAEKDRYRILIVNEIIPMEGGITGIPSEYEEYVFHPFFKLNNVYDEKFAGAELGLGVGLFLVNHLTQKMHGSVSIKMLSSLSPDNGKYLKRSIVVLDISFPYI